MRKVVAMGETIMDILFRGGQPVAAVPGGSSFNAMVSVGRSGKEAIFVGYTGGDYTGDQIAAFMRKNGVSTDFLDQRKGERSSISLAYLDERSDAHYVFYKDVPHLSGHERLPEFGCDDVLLYGSYFAICEGMRPMVNAMLAKAQEAEAIVYYDLNFRRSHAHELEALRSAIERNFQRSTIVRGSADDFEVMYASRDAEAVYRRHIAPHCPLFIMTAAEQPLTVCTPRATYTFPVPPLERVVSTVGAGDNFNAGFVCGLLDEGLRRADLLDLPREGWQRLVGRGLAFAREVCQTTDNYIRT